MSNHLAEHELGRVENEFGINLGRDHRASLTNDDDYYPQIDRAVRAEAARMAPLYEVFYALEKTIRGVITSLLLDAEGANWWTSARVPPHIQNEVKNRIQKEIDRGTTPRSGEPIDFTTFGELGDLITKNWEIFGSLFSSQKAVQKVLGSLNTLRAPIAHCSPLAEDEVVRLRLSVRDWFRLME
ncbi:MAG: Swt1 family HEPN domain-containing protein [Planctomycetota bacterium]